MSPFAGPVDALDRYLNRRLLSARDADVRAIWHTKVKAKQLLATVPDHEVNPLARRMLVILVRRERQGRSTARAA